MIHVAVRLIHGSIFDSLLESRLWPATGSALRVSSSRQCLRFSLSYFRFSHILYVSVETQVGTFKLLAARFSRFISRPGNSRSWLGNVRAAGGKMPSKGVRPCSASRS